MRLDRGAPSRDAPIAAAAASRHSCCCLSRAWVLDALTLACGNEKHGRRTTRTAQAALDEQHDNALARTKARIEKGVGPAKDRSVKGSIMFQSLMGAGVRNVAVSFAIHTPTPKLNVCCLYSSNRIQSMLPDPGLDMSAELYRTLHYGKGAANSTVQA